MVKGGMCFINEWNIMCESIRLGWIHGWVHGWSIVVVGFQYGPVLMVRVAVPIDELGKGAQLVVSFCDLTYPIHKIA